jgi:hypothetical protein
VKVTKRQLKQIIKEELETAMEEGAWDSIKGALGMGSSKPAADQTDAVPESEREDYDKFRSGGWSQQHMWEKRRGSNFDDTTSYEAYQDFLSWAAERGDSLAQDRVAQQDIEKGKRSRGSGGGTSVPFGGRPSTPSHRASSAVGSSNLAYGESVKNIKDIIKEVIQEVSKESNK